MASKTHGEMLGTIEPSDQEDGSEVLADDVAISQKSKKRGEDLNSGMELLELDFLLSIVEGTHGDNDNDVEMRKLTFYELLRRDNQNHIDSSALTVYTVNQPTLYPKDIQCEAMKELTKRTKQHN